MESDKDAANGNDNGTHDNATSQLRRANAARTLQAVAQAVLGVAGITGWEIMDVLAGGVGESDAVFTVRFSNFSCIAHRFGFALSRGECVFLENVAHGRNRN